jgi:hypothetical protein
MRAYIDQVSHFHPETERQASAEYQIQIYITLQHQAWFTISAKYMIGHRTIGGVKHSAKHSSLFALADVSADALLLRALDPSTSQ